MPRVSPAQRWRPQAQPSVVDAAPLPRVRALSAWLLVFLVAGLTLEWISLVNLGRDNLKWFHVAAIAFIVVYLVYRRPGRSLAPVLVANASVYLAWIVTLLLLLAFGLTQHSPVFGPLDVVRQVFYAGTSVVVAAFFLDIEDPRVRRIVAWAGVAGVVVVVAGLTLALRSQGTNPVTIFKETLATGNPDVLGRQLLASAFTSQEITQAGVNLRHKVFGAVLIATFLGLAVGHRHRLAGGSWRQWLFKGATALGFALVVLSLSRSVTLGLVFTAVIYVGRAVIGTKARPMQAAAILSGVVVVAVMFLSPLGAVVTTRWFSETDSYDARLSNTDTFVSQMSGAAVAGLDSPEKTPHIMLADVFLSGGVLTAVPATIFLLGFVRRWGREVVRYLNGGQGWVVPVGHIWVIGLGVSAIVRMFTASDGLHMNDWVAIGATLGIIQANERAVARGDEIQPAQVDDTPPPSRRRSRAVPGRANRQPATVS